MAQEFRLVAKTLFGLEEVLAQELRGMGAREVEPFNRLVTFKGDLRMMYKANFCCRAAIRILRRVKKFNVTDEQRLYDEIKAMDWSAYLDPDGTLAIDPVVTNSTFTHSLYVAQKAKDAIADQFRERTGRRPSVDLNNPDLRLNLHMNQNIVTLYLDSSGDSLHKRGYRTQTNVAPINEVLAAGIILLTGWDRKSPFADGMCGSGTIPIEAALLARNIAPGVFRKQFGFERWKDYDKELYRAVFREAELAEIPKLPFEIVGSDHHAPSVLIARQNVKNAGLENDVRIELKRFEDQTPPQPPGVLVMNPPYGERLGAPEISAMYRMIGDRLKAEYAGWRAWLISGNLDALRNVGLRPAREIAMFNGPIESKLVEYRMHGRGLAPAPRKHRESKPRINSDKHGKRPERK